MATKNQIFYEPEKVESDYSKSDIIEKTAEKIICFLTNPTMIMYKKFHPKKFNIMVTSFFNSSEELKHFKNNYPSAIKIFIQYENFFLFRVMINIMNKIKDGKLTEKAGEEMFGHILKQQFIDPVLDKK